MFPRRIIKNAKVASGLTVWLFVTPSVVHAQSPDFEGSTHGFPVLRNSNGKELASSDFSQWLERDRLHVKIRHDFSKTHWIEEQSIFSQTPRLVQEHWSWREHNDGNVQRDFRIDFRSGLATAAKLEGNERREWSDKVEINPGSTFAGFGFSLAIKRLRHRLLMGERIELRTVGFTPKPRGVSVEISHGGLDDMRMSGRTLRGDRFVIHPKIPWIANFFIDVPDTHLWLTNPAPAGFLRMEGPLVEPDDQIVRIDLLPGGESGPATPSKARERPGSEAKKTTTHKRPSKVEPAQRPG
jgi:hypothetical protein